MISALCERSKIYLRASNAAYRRSFIQKKPFKHRLSLLLGQRGIGKTATVVQYLLDQANQSIDDPSILYVNVNDFLIVNTSLYHIADELYAMGGKYLVFDEIQTYRNWAQELISIYDAFPQLTVVAVGSSALPIYKESHDLSVRAAVYTMAGLSLREYIELSLGMKLSAYSLDEIISAPEHIGAKIVQELKDVKIEHLYEAYLYRGYYPFFFKLELEERYALMLEQNMHRTIESDIWTIHPHLTYEQVRILKKLLSFIAQSVPFMPNWNSIKEFLEIEDKRTLKTYFSYLADAALIRSLPKPMVRMDRVRQEEKIYLNNPNQMPVLSFDNHDPTKLQETFFITMLSVNHEVAFTQEDYFCIDKMYCFEIDCKKSTKQRERDRLPIIDAVETGIGSKIPLWLFGFLY